MAIIFTAPTLTINGSTSESAALTGVLRQSGGSISGDGSSNTDWMSVDIYKGSGTWVYSTSMYISDSQSYTLPNPSQYSYTTPFYVVCTHQNSGTTARTNTVFFQYVSETITAPTNLLVNGSASSTAPTCTLTWTASVCSDPTATIKYKIYDGSTLLADNFTATTYTFSRAICSQWTGTRTLKVCGYVTAYSLTSDMSNSVTFTYRNSYTVKIYWNGGWQECIAYYYNNGSWQECIPYVYDNGWKACSAS